MRKFKKLYEGEEKKVKEEWEKRKINENVKREMIKGGDREKGKEKKEGTCGCRII